MTIFEIVIPGTWLDYPDRDWTWRIGNLLQSLEKQFFEANAALNLFDQAQAVRFVRPKPEERERELDRHRELEEQVLAELSSTGSEPTWSDVRFEADIRFKREQWAAGKVPREFEHNLPLIHARSFLYALDGFDKFLGVLVKEEGTPPLLPELRTQFAAAFPHLREVRNTAQHLEDRSRGLGAGRKPQPLKLQPVANGFVQAPEGGALILNCLNGTRLGSTMADGNYGEIDVSAATMRFVRATLQNVLNAFSWKGPKRHAPGA